MIDQVDSQSQIRESLNNSSLINRNIGMTIRVFDGDLS
jgi:hypothetical protein